MNTLWYKVRTDLLLHKSRTSLAIISIAVGVFCVGTLFGMIDLLLAKMDAAHQDSRPSHINFIFRNEAESNVLNAIRALPDITASDTLTPLTVRFRRPGTAEWRLATVIIRPDYPMQTLDKTRLLAGTWPDSAQIAVENLTAQADGLAIGDRIELETEAGKPILPIVGVVRHPFVKPPKFGGQAYFFASPAAAGVLGAKPSGFRQLLLQIAPPYGADKAREVAGHIHGLLAQRGIGVNATLLQDPDKHWGRPFLAGINDVLQAMALASLALACVLTTNTIAAHVTQQIDQIGVMKALGARTATVTGIYLSETLLIAVAALLLAIVPALVAANVSAGRLLGLFNIASSGFSVSPRAVGYMVAGGLLTPVAVALVPVLRAAAMPARLAMASYGLGANCHLNRVDVWIEMLGARFLPTLYAAALGNFLRHKLRLLLTLSVLVIAGVMFLVLASLLASLNLTLDHEIARSHYAVRLGFSTDQAETKIREIAGSVPLTQQVETWQRLPVRLTANGVPLRQQGSLGLQLLGVPADSKLYQPRIESGRWLTAADAGQKLLVLNAETAALNAVQVGDTLTLGTTSTPESWRVIGTYRWLTGSQYAVEPVYVPLDSVRDRTRSAVATQALIAAPVADRTAEADYLRQVAQAFQDRGIKLDVFATQAKLEQDGYLRHQFRPVISTLSGLAAMVAAVGGIGLSGTLAIGVLQRTREIGVLRAIGASGPAIFRLFLAEGLFYALAAWIVSVPMAWLCAEPLATRLGQTMLGIRLDFCFQPWTALAWLILVVALAALAAYWPARRASTLVIRECLAH